MTGFDPHWSAPRVGLPPPPPERYRLAPLAPLINALPAAPQTVIVAAVSGFASPLMIPFGVGFVVLVVGGLYLSWSRFHYSVEGRNLVVESGLLSLNRRVVPLDRIQQVNLQRKLRHRVSGLAVVRIDTAGTGDAPEVVLDAVTVAEAERLRRVLRRGDAGMSTGVTAMPGAPAETSIAPERDDEREVLSLGYGRLALAGVTGSGLLVVFAVVGSLIGLAEQLSSASVVTDLAEQVFDAADDGPPNVLVVLGLVLVALPVWLLIGAGASVVADGGFTLTVSGDQIRVRRGLLDQREVTLSTHRVQVAKITENGLRRLLGLSSVTFQSAGGSTGVEGNQTNVRVPLLTRPELELLLGVVLPTAPGSPALQPAPGAARRRAMVRRVVPATIVAAALAVLAAINGDPWSNAAPLLVVLPLLAAGHGELAYRALGWTLHEGYVHTRTGAVGREVAVVPVAKAQSTRLTTSYFQRRARLATLWIDVAGGGAPAIPDGSGEALCGLRTGALTTAAARRDEAAVRRRATAGRASEMADT